MICRSLGIKLFPTINDDMQRYTMHIIIQLVIFSAFVLVAHQNALAGESILKIKEPFDALQRYEIDDIEFNPDIKNNNETNYILTYAPEDNYRYRLFVGDYVGKNFGMVMALAPGYMLIREVHDCGKNKHQLKWLTYLVDQDKPEKLKRFSERIEACE